MTGRVVVPDRTGGRSLAFRILHACGRLRESVADDPVGVAARALHALAQSGGVALNVEIWNALTTIERDEITAWAAKQKRASIDARLADATGARSL